jgi:hypothetical protein
MVISRIYGKQVRGHSDADASYARLVESSNDYHFLTVWELENTSCEEVSAVPGKAEDLVRWWPSVYLDVKVVDPGGPGGIGKRVKLLTKGRLPCTLLWEFTTIASNEPYGFSLEAKGDFVGRGIWTFAQQDTKVRVVYDWKIRAEKPLLKALSFLMKPVFSWNHRWAMKQGYESLKRELVRRKAE